MILEKTTMARVTTLSSNTLAHQSRGLKAHSPSYDLMEQAPSADASLFQAERLPRCLIVSDPAIIFLSKTTTEPLEAYTI